MNGHSDSNSNHVNGNGHHHNSHHNHDGMPVPTKKQKILCKATLSDSLKSTSYAVRGPLAILADQLQGDLAAAKANGPDAEAELIRKRGWKNVVSTNIGNPQALGQVPVTFFRQVSATSFFVVTVCLSAACPGRTVDGRWTVPLAFTSVNGHGTMDLEGTGNFQRLAWVVFGTGRKTEWPPSYFRPRRKSSCFESGIGESRRLFQIWLPTEWRKTIAGARGLLAGIDTTKWLTDIHVSL